MRVIDAIREADAYRPNSVDSGLKVLWLKRFEEDVREMTGTERPQEFNDETELIFTDADEGVYTLYLASKIDEQNMDTTLYANDAAAFNSAYAEAKARYRRANRYYGADIKAF